MLELVSAAMDDEASEFEVRRLVDEAVRNPEVCDAWARYHLVSEALRAEMRSARDEPCAGARGAARADLASDDV